jgi:hypothetical protein
MRSIIIGGLAALAFVLSGWVGGIQPARAVDPGPAQFALLQPTTAGCPAGVEVATNPGPIQMFIPPSASGGLCAPGITVSKDPGPGSAPGMTFGLPLNAGDCADGTATLNGILEALGGTPGVPGGGPAGGPTSDPADPCPAGTAAMAGIESAIVTAERQPGPSQCPAGSVATGPLGRGTLVLKNPGPPSCPPGTTLGVVQDAAGTAWGFLTLVRPPSPNSPTSWEFDSITPSGMPGESMVMPVGFGG